MARYPLVLSPKQPYGQISSYIEEVLNGNLIADQYSAV